MIEVKARKQNGEKIVQLMYDDLLDEYTLSTKIKGSLYSKREVILSWPEAWFRYLEILKFYQL